jgi:hypothetical protein
MPKKEALRRISRLLAATDLSARSDRAVGVAGSLGAFVVTMLLESERGRDSPRGSGPIDYSMEHHSSRRIGGSLDEPRNAEQDGPENEDQSRAEAGVKDRVKKTLNDPGTAAEDRLLAGLDESLHHNSSPMTLTAKNGSQKARR